MKNKRKIKITGYPHGWDGSVGSPQTESEKAIHLAIILPRLCLMRTAKAIGDQEVINHTQLGRLNDMQIPYEIVE
jgi:hypothetical protein